jgi:adenosylcobinamide-GDP ribazoletransferase
MRAVGFLSRLPVSPSHFSGLDDSRHLRDDAAAFAIAGILIAVAPALGLVAALSLGFPVLVAATMSVLLMAAVTGGLHEDGLADVADGFGGGSDKARRLDIMKDSAIGTYGAIALCGSLLLRVGALTALVAAHGAWAAALGVVAVAAASRAAMVWFWAGLPNARGGGTAAGAGSPTDRAVTLAAVTGIIVFVPLGAAAAGLFNMAAALLIAACGMVAFSRFCQRTIGGHTGDTLGACQQIVECLLLAGLAIRFSVPT